MDTKTQLMVVLMAAILLVAGWLAGGSGNVVEAQTGDPLLDLFGENLLDGYEWRMFSENVAGTGGSGGAGAGGESLSGGYRGSVGDAVRATTWLYNAKSGKVYRVYTKCGGDEGTHGCLFAMPVFSGDPAGPVLAEPGYGQRSAGLRALMSCMHPRPCSVHI